MSSVSRLSRTRSIALGRSYRINANSTAGAIGPQHLVQNVIDGVDENDLHFIAQLSGNVIKIMLITPRQSDGTNSSTAGREHFFFNTTHWQYLAAQRDLAGHCDIRADRPAGHQRGQRRGDSHT